MMKKIKTTEAVGHVLQHDITEIIPGEFKGRVFKKGHIITEENIPHLLRLGKDHIFVFELGEDKIHENEGAMILGKLGQGENISLGSEIKEGKINFNSSIDGILKVDSEKLFELNMLGEISFATLPNNIPVKKGELVGGARIIPLVIEKEKMDRAKSLIKDPILNVRPYKKYKVGIITTGNEVFYGRIQDKFGPVIKSKVGEYNCEVVSHVFSPDDKEKIKHNLMEALESVKKSIREKL